MENILNKPNITLKELEFYLLVLLYPDGAIAEEFIQREDIDGITSALVFHDAESNDFKLIPKKYLQKLRFDSDTLITIGLRNTFRMFPALYKKDFKLEHGSVMWDTMGSLVEGHPFTATSVLNHKTFPEIGKYGSLVIFPLQYTAGVLAINDYHALAALVDMAHLAEETYTNEKATHRKLSNLVYWYYKGKFKAIARINSEGNLHIRPDAEFGDILDKLDGRKLIEKLREKIFFWPLIFTSINGKEEDLFYLNEKKELVDWAGRVSPGQTIEEGIATELADTLSYKGKFEYKMIGLRDTILDKKGNEIDRYLIHIKLLDKLESTKTKFGWDIVFK